jgi:acetyl-CoA carboxylase biotin carboxylase subunit
MSDVAVKAGLACGYIGAGTVEMLYDPKNSSFYFLVMNTRLQVEHPITELVTGIDLVREQIKIARGEHINIDQHRVRHRGHAIECRIYAEDTASGFLPDAGTVEKLALPSGPGVRLDSGVEKGSEVGVYYDPMVAKLAVWDVDRPSAIAKMHRALSEYRISGFKTTIPFARWVMENERFVSGDYDTAFVENEYTAQHKAQQDSELTRATIVAAVLYQHRATVISSNGDTDKELLKSNNWKQSGRIQGMN